MKPNGQSMRWAGVVRLGHSEHRKPKRVFQSRSSFASKYYSGNHKQTRLMTHLCFLFSSTTKSQAWGEANYRVKTHIATHMSIKKTLRQFFFLLLLSLLLLTHWPPAGDWPIWSLEGQCMSRIEFEDPKCKWYTYSAPDGCLLVHHRLMASLLQRGQSADACSLACDFLNPIDRLLNIGHCGCRWWYLQKRMVLSVTKRDTQSRVTSLREEGSQRILSLNQLCKRHRVENWIQYYLFSLSLSLSLSFSFFLSLGVSHSLCFRFSPFSRDQTGPILHM